LILWRNERDKPVDKQTATWLASFEIKTKATLARFEQDIVPIGSGPLSLSSITLGCCLSYLDFRYADMNWRADHPALATWHATFAQRPSVSATEIIQDV
jgi:glutathione S-transferase